MSSLVTVLSLVLLAFWISFSSADSYFSNDLANSESNFYTNPCTYDRQCDERTGYVCRDGRCACKFGRPDVTDDFKCKVQVKLGDDCRELPISKRDPRSPVYVRRKCPRNSECGQVSGICECGPLFELRGAVCTPKVVKAGGKECRDHLDCMVQRGQLCHNATCVECALGQFKNFRPTAKWVEARLECSCFDKLAELQGNGTNQIRHKRMNKNACTAPVSVGDHCTVSRNCLSAWTPQLICDGGTCNCPPGSRQFRFPTSHPLSTFCISPINSPCTDDQDCHGPTAYCETRLELPMCKCRDGFELQGLINKGGAKKDQFRCTSRFHEEVCGKFFPQNNRLRDQLKQQKLTCIQGVYECARPREMFWDMDRGKCVSLVGGRCDLDLFDLSSCAGISRCWEYKSLGEFRCQCPMPEESEDNKISDIITRGDDNKLGFTEVMEMLRFKPSRNRRNCVRSEE